MRRAAALILLLLVSATGASAATPLPLEPPLPDLAPLIPFVAPPLDKPVLELRELPLPPAPLGLPPLPLPPLALDLSHKPTVTLPEPRRFPPPCIGSFLGVASELLECGRLHFGKGAYEEARAQLEGATRGSDRMVVREARYWLGETLLRLGQPEAAERNFLLVAQDGPGSELGDYALVSLGWIALRLNDPARAQASFDTLLRGGPVPALTPFARHGRALALFGLGRYAEAREAWASLLTTRLPQSVSLEVPFWLGESLARLGDPAKGEEELRRFAASGLSHPLLQTAILRLGWWALAASHPVESVKAYRWLLSAFPNTPELPWARAGLVRALLASDDWSGARLAMEELAATRGGRDLILPSLLALSRWAVERKAYADARSIHQEIFGLDLTPEVRAYVLFLDGEAFSGEGQAGAARAQYELVRSGAGATDLGWRASLRIAQLDLEAREFARTLTETQALLKLSLSPELRAAALLLSGEAAYWAREYEAAAGAFGRFASEFPNHPRSAAVTMSLGWAELRRGRLLAARDRWTAVAQRFPTDERTGEALLLAAELAGQSGDLATAGDLLDQGLARSLTPPQLDVAQVNRAIVRLRVGRFEEASAGVNELLSRAPSSPYAGRAHLTHGAALLALGRPGEAFQEFTAALQQGESALARLGLGILALGERHWDEATQNFEEARDSGSAPARQAALYGLAATAFLQGNRQEFGREAGALLQQAPAAPAAPRLLYLLSALAVEEKAWPRAKDLTLRLVTDHSGSEEADDSLSRLGSGAGAAAQWGLAREAWELLLVRYPQSPFRDDARVGLGEALLRLGAVTEARKLLETAVAAIPSDPRLPQALLLLAQSREATGDRAGAIEGYDRIAREFPDADIATAARLGQGRLLLQAGRWGESRRLLEAVLAGGDQIASAEAAYHLGEGLRSRGDHEAAVEAYMSAAYLAPTSPWGRRALHGAGRSFAVLKQTEAAGIVYRKLLAQPDVEPELAEEAKKALRRLGQNP
jgi:TolA-binding protein